MDLTRRYTNIADLKARAQKRIPPFVWALLDSATGTEATLRRNRTMLDKVLMMPSILHGEIAPDLGTSLLGQIYRLPFGVSPVAMSGLIWPDAEFHLARAACAAGMPYGLSNVATRTPEEMGPRLDGNGWFQIYPPRDIEIRKDLLARVREAGFDVLVLTADVPVASRREKQVKGGMTNPPRLTPRLLAQIATRPAWALGQARPGPLPHMATLDRYAQQNDAKSSIAHVGYLLRTSPDMDYLHWLRAHWQGKLVVKGVMRAEDAPRLEAAGVDALWVSNHAGRQFDGAPSSIEALPAIRSATDLPLIFDSGIEGGLDILRAISLGADFVMLGRAFHFALGALGPAGPDHLVDLLTRDLVANLGQLGAARPTDLRGAALLDHGFGTTGNLV